MSELTPDQKLLVKDLELIEHMVYKDTNLLIHVGRIKDKAIGGYYHLGREQMPICYRCKNDQEPFCIGCGRLRKHDSELVNDVLDKLIYWLYDCPFKEDYSSSKCHRILSEKIESLQKVYRP